MTEIPSFEKVVSAHGHTCPGIAVGYKIAVEAAKWSGNETNIRVYSTTTRCPLDALRTTFDLKAHPERLTIDDKNELHFILTKPDGSRMFIDEIPGTKIKSAEGDAITEKIKKGTASPDEIIRLDEIRDELLQQTLATPNDKLFVFRYE